MAKSRDNRVKFDTPVEKVYDAFYGHYGPTERKLRQTIRRSDTVFFGPGSDFDDKPTVKVDQYFFVNEKKKLCDIQAIVTDSKVYLHGILRPWSAMQPAYSFGNARILEWCVYCRVIAGDEYFWNNRFKL